MFRGDGHRDLRDHAILAKFPRPDWSEERYAEIMRKDPLQRSAEEAEFVQRFGDWLESGKATGQEDRKKLLEKTARAGRKRRRAGRVEHVRTGLG